MSTISSTSTATFTAAFTNPVTTDTINPRDQEMDKVVIHTENASSSANSTASTSSSLTPASTSYVELPSFALSMSSFSVPPVRIPIQVDTEVFCRYRESVDIPPYISGLEMQMCPFSTPQQPFSQTHTVVLVPNEIPINKKFEMRPFTLHALQQHCRDHNIWTFFDPVALSMYIPPVTSHWVVETNNSIPGTSNQPFAKQHEIIKRFGYTFPNLIDAVTILLRDIKAGRLVNREIICNEPIGQSHLVARSDPKKRILVISMIANTSLRGGIYGHRVSHYRDRSSPKWAYSSSSSSAATTTSVKQARSPSSSSPNQPKTEKNPLAVW